MGRGLQDRTSVLVCRGCCCGTTGKHPTVDHDEHLRRLREATFDGGARLWTVDCLGPCERSNVVVVRRRGVRRWLGGMLDDERIDLLAEWLRDPTAQALAHSLGQNEFPAPNGAGLVRRRLLPLAGARLADRCAELLA